MYFPTCPRPANISINDPRSFYKNSHFLRTDHRNVVHENFFRVLRDIICIKNLFKPIRVINRTNSWAIWTRISEQIDHFQNGLQTLPKKKLPFGQRQNISLQIEFEDIKKWQKTACFLKSKISNSFKSTSGRILHG